MIVALWGRDQLAEDTGVEDSGGWGGVTLAYNTRSPEEVDAVLAEVEAAGGTVLRRGAETFWGGYSGAFADPEGHAWEVAHNPHWTLAEDGSSASETTSDDLPAAVAARPAGPRGSRRFD